MIQTSLTLPRNVNLNSNAVTPSPQGQSFQSEYVLVCATDRVDMDARPEQIASGNDAPPRRWGRTGAFLVCEKLEGCLVQFPSRQPT